MTIERQKLKFIDASLDNFSDTLDRIDIKSDLIPDYSSNVKAILDRLYVPNIVTDEYGRRQLETPKRYSGSEYLGVIALRAGEAVVPDLALVQQTIAQQSHTKRTLESIDSSMTFDDMLKSRNYYHDEFATVVPITVEPHHVAHVTPGGMSMNRRIGIFTSYQKPLLVFNMDTSHELLDAGVIGHEMMHMYDWGNIGVNAAPEVDDRIAWMENRAYYIERLINDALIENGSEGLLDRSTKVFSERIDDIRSEFCDDGSFSPTSEYYDAMRKANLMIALGRDQESELQSPAPPTAQPSKNIIQPLEHVKKSRIQRLFRSR